MFLLIIQSRFESTWYSSFEVCTRETHPTTFQLDDPTIFCFCARVSMDKKKTKNEELRKLHALLDPTPLNAAVQPGPIFSLLYALTFCEREKGGTNDKKKRPTIRHLAEVHGLSFLVWVYGEEEHQKGKEAKEDTSRHDGPKFKRGSRRRSSWLSLDLDLLLLG